MSEVSCRVFAFYASAEAAGVCRVDGLLAGLPVTREQLERPGGRVAWDVWARITDRFAEACGTTRERVTDIDNATAVTRGLQGWCYAISMREHFAVATAALVVGLESQVPSIYRRQYPVLIEKYGFTEEEAEFFDLHITSDEIHGERGYQIVLEHATTPDLQTRCLQLVRHGAEARFSYTKSLYDTYVMPEASFANPAPALA